MSAPPQIRDETGTLATVVVGIASDPGVSNGHNITDSTYFKVGDPLPEAALRKEVEAFVKVLKKRKIEVLRPDNIPGILQIFVRDLGFVVGDTLFWANLKWPARKREQQALRGVLKKRFPKMKTVPIPKDLAVEGGDIVLAKGKVFVGVGTTRDRRRTDRRIVGFLRSHLPTWEVIELPTRASDNKDDDPRRCVLHLDCAFQPLGNGQAVLFEAGFSRRPDVLYDLFGAKNIVKVTGKQMFGLWPNILSLSETTVVCLASSKTLNEKLRKRGFEVLEVEYGEVTRQGGSFRCSTLPIRREYR